MFREKNLGIYFDVFFGIQIDCQREGLTRPSIFFKKDEVESFHLRLFESGLSIFQVVSSWDPILTC